MFINCPYCKALVSTDPVTDLPPTHCPHCDSLLRRDPEAVDDMAEIAPLDLGTLLDPRAIAEAAAEAEANAAARAAAAIQTPRVEAPVAEATDIASILESVRIDAARQTQASDDEGTAVADATDAVSAPADTRVPAAVAIAPAISPAVATRRLPSFARNADGSARPARERWLIVAVIALAVLLVLQLLLADRARLAANAQWRPLLATLCGAVRCELPPWREPAAFTLLQRDVRQHPTLPGVLRVSATLDGTGQRRERDRGDGHPRTRAADRRLRLQVPLNAPNVNGGANGVRFTFSTRKAEPGCDAHEKVNLTPFAADPVCGWALSRTGQCRSSGRTTPCALPSRRAVAAGPRPR